MALKYFRVTQHYISLSLLQPGRNRIFILGLAACGLLASMTEASGETAPTDADAGEMPAPHPQKEELLTLARQGDAGAQYHPGIMYMYGEEVEQDRKEAFKWVSLAAQRQFAPALYGLGLMHEQGQGVKQDWNEAFKYDGDAARHHYVLARM